MDFLNGGQPIGVDSPCKLDQCGPQPSVNIADFAIDEPTNQNLPCLSERSRDFPNLLSFSVSSPASANWDPGNRFSQVWNRTVSGFQHNTSIFQESNCVLCGHRVGKYRKSFVMVFIELWWQEQERNQVRHLLNGDSVFQA